MAVKYFVSKSSRDPITEEDQQFIRQLKQVTRPLIKAAEVNTRGTELHIVGFYEETWRAHFPTKKIAVFVSKAQSAVGVGMLIGLRGEAISEIFHRDLNGLKGVLLHELIHARQHQLGLPMRHDDCFKNLFQVADKENKLNVHKYEEFCDGRYNG